MNYRRVWARDGLIAALGAVLGEHPHGVTWLEATLRTLATAQGPAGQIPSNVTLGVEGQRSYGTAAVRIDATLWFMVGVGVLRRHTVATAHDHALENAATCARRFIRAWEGNERGLLYVPRAGNWADEYPIHGYTLYDNVLRLWAELEVASSEKMESDRWPFLVDAIATAFFDDTAQSNNEAANVVPAYVAPGERSPRQCTFGLALAALLFANPRSPAIKIGRRAVERLSHLKDMPTSLLPAYWPTIEPGDVEWTLLEGLADYGLRNTPGRYHNGGQWPMVNGFVAAAFRRHAKDAEADAIANAIANANVAGDFPEYLDATTGEGAGTKKMAWSASAEAWASASESALTAFLPPALNHRGD